MPLLVAMMNEDVDFITPKAMRDCEMTRILRGKYIHTASQCHFSSKQCLAIYWNRHFRWNIGSMSLIFMVHYMLSWWLEMALSATA